MNLILSVFWFFLPAGIANMAPVLFSRLKFFSTPVDFGKKYGGQPIVGSHKTYRGFVVGTLAAIMTVAVQKMIYPAGQTISIVNYDTISAWQLGFLLGFGALFGDLAKSFIKRRLGKPSGSAWPPYDQLDWIVGAIVFVSFYVTLSFKQIVVALILFGALHPLFSLVGYKLKLKKNKF